MYNSDSLSLTRLISPSICLLSFNCMLQLRPNLDQMPAKKRCVRPASGSQPHNHTASQPHCLTASQPHCLTAPRLTASAPESTCCFGAWFVLLLCSFVLLASFTVDCTLGSDANPTTTMVYFVGCTLFPRCDSCTCACSRFTNLQKDAYWDYLAQQAREERDEDLDVESMMKVAKPLAEASTARSGPTDEERAALLASAMGGATVSGGGGGSSSSSHGDGPTAEQKAALMANAMKSRAANPDRGSGGGGKGPSQDARLKVRVGVCVRVRARARTCAPVCVSVWF
jgi:hypothetical protein